MSGCTAGRSTLAIPTAAASIARSRCCTAWPVNYDAWATGVRRDQSPTRADTPIVKWDKKFGLVKISPLACWTKKDVWKRIVDEERALQSAARPELSEHRLPALHAAGESGEDERAGRWSGSAKTECGLAHGRGLISSILAAPGVDRGAVVLDKATPRRYV